MANVTCACPFSPRIKCALAYCIQILMEKIISQYVGSVVIVLYKVKVRRQDSSAVFLFKKQLFSARDFAIPGYINSLKYCSF